MKMITGTSLSDLDEFQVPVNVALSQADIPLPCPQNRVVITNFGTTFNHKQCVGLIPGASFKNCRLSAYTARFYDPGHFMEPTGQGFTSGLYVSMGTNSERVSLLFIHIFRGIISNIPGLPRRPRNSPMFVCNKVSSGVYDPLDIRNFEKNDGTRVISHRKSFSGVIYKRLIRFIPHSVKLVSISLFESGNYIVMNVEGIEALIAFIYFLPILQRNKLHKTAKPSADQVITFIRQKFRNENPTKDTIVECVKTAIAEAERAVVTREQIIQRAIQNASRIQKPQRPIPSCSLQPEICEVTDELEYITEEIVDDEYEDTSLSCTFSNNFLTDEVNDQDVQESNEVIDDEVVEEEIVESENDCEDDISSNSDSYDSNDDSDSNSGEESQEDYHSEEDSSEGDVEEVVESEVESDGSELERTLEYIMEDTLHSDSHSDASSSSESELEIIEQDSPRDRKSSTSFLYDHIDEISTDDEVISENDVIFEVDTFDATPLSRPRFNQSLSNQPSSSSKQTITKKQRFF